MFDVERLADFAEAEIHRFAAEHQEEAFYAFAIDAQLLCLNSEAQFEKTLAAYRGDLSGEDAVRALKYNPGDWEYQGFAVFGEQDGFDEALYGEHYNMPPEQQKTSEYAEAMDRVLELLAARDALGTLRKTDDFLATRVEHEY